MYHFSDTYIFHLRQEFSEASIFCLCTDPMMKPATIKGSNHPKKSSFCCLRRSHEAQRNQRQQLCPKIRIILQANILSYKKQAAHAACSLLLLIDLVDIEVMQTPIQRFLVAVHEDIHVTVRCTAVLDRVNIAVDQKLCSERNAAHGHCMS